MKKLMMQGLEKLLKTKRLNLKVDLTFWVLKPYLEQLTYEINGQYYRPTSLRVLCFAIVIVQEGDKIEFTPDQEFKRTVKRLEKDAKTNSTRA